MAVILVVVVLAMVVAFGRNDALRAKATSAFRAWVAQRGRDVGLGVLRFFWAWIRSRRRQRQADQNVQAVKPTCPTVESLEGDDNDDDDDDKEDMEAEISKLEARLQQLRGEVGGTPYHSVIYE